MSSASASGHGLKNDTRSRPTLTNLPQELRLLIWEQVFRATNVKVKVHPIEVGNAIIGNPLHRDARISPHPLFYINRQTYEEAVDLFYMHAVFMVEIRAIPLLREPLPVVVSQTANLTSASIGMAAKIQSLSITVFAYCCYYDRTGLGQIKKPTSKTTIFEFPLPNLKYLRLDWHLDRYSSFSPPGSLVGVARKQAQSLFHLVNAPKPFDLEICIELQDYEGSKPLRLSPYTSFVANYTPPAGLVFKYRDIDDGLEAYEDGIRSALGVGRRAS